MTTAWTHRSLQSCPGKVFAAWFDAGPITARRAGYEHEKPLDGGYRNVCPTDQHGRNRQQSGERKHNGYKRAGEISRTSCTRPRCAGSRHQFKLEGPHGHSDRNGNQDGVSRKAFSAGKFYGNRQYLDLAIQGNGFFKASRLPGCLHTRRQHQDRPNGNIVGASGCSSLESPYPRRRLRYIWILPVF